MERFETELRWSVIGLELVKEQWTLTGEEVARTSISTMITVRARDFRLSVAYLSSVFIDYCRVQRHIDHNVLQNRSDPTNYGY